MTVEQILTVNGAEHCVQTFGEAHLPTVLLVAGMSSPMDWWEDGFCERLAAGGRRVVRYDFRDTGRSTTYPPGRPGYTAADLRDDVLGLLDALDVQHAHLVGISMGGGIAQCLAVERPDRVATLTLMCTTAALPGVDEELPGVAPELAAYFATAATRPEPDWSDAAAVVDRMVEDQRAYMRGGFDEARVRAVAERVVQRSTDLAAAANHQSLGAGREPDASITDIETPTLVVHGTADPLFPPAHAVALAQAIPQATLLLLEGAGHEPPPPADWDRVVTALLSHTSVDVRPVGD